MRWPVRLLGLGAVAMIVAGCANTSTQAAGSEKPAAPGVSMVFNGALPNAKENSSGVLPLTSPDARDQISYISGSQRLSVTEGGKDILALQHVLAWGGAEFQGSALPLLLVSFSGRGPWGNPVTTYAWNAKAHALLAVPYAPSASRVATFAWTGKRFAPSSGDAARTTSLGPATMQSGGLTVTQFVPRAGGTSPSAFVLTSRWRYETPKDVWTLQDASYGPSAVAPAYYPQAAAGTAEAYLTAVALGIKGYAQDLSATSAAGLYAKLRGMVKQPGIGTPLPSFDASSFQAQAVAAGQRGVLTMDVWSGAGPTLRFSKYEAKVGLTQQGSRWKVASVDLRRMPAYFPTPAAVAKLVSTSTEMQSFIAKHKRTTISVGVYSGSQFYIDLGYSGKPRSTGLAHFAVNAATGAWQYYWN